MSSNTQQVLHATQGQDDSQNDSRNGHFDQVLQARLSRRAFLRGAAGASVAPAAKLGIAGGLGGFLTACGSDGDTSSTAVPVATSLAFAPVAKSLADAVSVPAEYTWSVVHALGDPLDAATPAWSGAGTETGASYERRVGDHHDGMWFFGMTADGRFDPGVSDRGLLCVNHENITQVFLHPAAPGAAPRPVDEVLKEISAHGVSVTEVVRGSDGRWTVDRNSRFNRRITPNTVMSIQAPAAALGDVRRAMITRFSPDGSTSRGTINNCASGHTPWGTYLTCEENWNGYFRRGATDAANRSARDNASLARYGIAAGSAGAYNWSTATAADAADTTFSRWNITVDTNAPADGSGDFRNEANTFGYVVEIDPFAPTSVPRKRTALGRFAHEGAWVAPAVAGQPLVFYMGCDSRNEYIYKFVSAANWDPADVGGGLAAGDKYMNEGTLYVARFNADGSGNWLALRFGANGITASNAAFAFANQGDVHVHTRLAADAAGATKMDRPEWGAVNPANGEVYFTLTNTNAASRPVAAVDAANPRFYNDRRGTTNQLGNPNGHIIRWREAGGVQSATSFQWDVFLFGARAGTDAATVNLSGLTAGNDFSSPDGLYFGRNGVLWIETDDGAYTDVTNCMLLAALPGRVGDGARRTVTSTDGVNTKSVDTFVGAQATESTVRRFLVSPRGAEVTGITETPDGRTLFVNIQHPGESTASLTSTFQSNWPDGGTSRPRSATIAISRRDGGLIAG